ncbi:MAG: TlpA disulfide reductase family protein [Gammaproteobacteria bacterium]|nr:MAG: TlpA disulfide reductase family protein [Gammaproteobacteria bacterium]
MEFILLDENKLSLTELRGRPVLVGLWATSCPPCVEEVPDLIALYRELHPRGLEFIAVAMPYDPLSHVLAFSRRYRIPYPIALDVAGKAVRAFDVGPIPAAFLISPEGNIVYHQLGKLDIGKAQRIILRLLGEEKTL